MAIGVIKTSIAYRATRRIMEDLSICKCKNPQPVSNENYKASVLICQICNLLVRQKEEE